MEWEWNCNRAFIWSDTQTTLSKRHKIARLERKTRFCVTKIEIQFAMRDIPLCGRKELWFFVDFCRLALMRPASPWENIMNFWSDHFIHITVGRLFLIKIEISYDRWINLGNTSLIWQIDKLIDLIWDTLNLSIWLPLFIRHNIKTI